jgi:hypothetical protein
MIWKPCPGFVWIRKVTGSELLRTQKWAFGVGKTRNNFSPSVEVLPSQQETCSRDFVARRRRNNLLCSPQILMCRSIWDWSLNCSVRLCRAHTRLCNKYVCSYVPNWSDRRQLPHGKTWWAEDRQRDPFCDDRIICIRTGQCEIIYVGGQRTSLSTVVIAVT